MIDDVIDLQDTSDSDVLEKTSLLSLKQIQKKLRDRRLMFVAQESGLTFMTLSRLVKGVGRPSYSTMAKLSRYFEEYK